VRGTLPVLATLAVACSAHGSSPAGALAQGSPSGLAAPISLATPSGASQKERFPSYIAALAWETRVMEQPSGSSTLLGYLRAGAVVPASGVIKRGEGCHGEWHAIAPAGYVCLEPNVATLDVDNPVVHALATRPDLGERLPYMYGLVRKPGPIYARLPTLAEAREAEIALDARMRRWLNSAGEDGAAFRADYWRRKKTDPTPSPLALWETHATVEVPDWLAGKFPPGNLSGMRERDHLVVGVTKLHNGFALVDTAVAEGRRYGITTDLLVYPVDRMRPIEGSPLHGYRIPEDIDFPFALVGRAGARAREARGKQLGGGHEVPRHTAIRLSGNQRFFDGVLHLETADGLWLSERFVSRIDGTRKMPKWATDGERWIDVSIRKQVLMAYEGTKPVYVTLVSTGEAGLGDPSTSKSTVLGAFRIFAKHLTTTMSSEVVGEEFELKDIPYVQYFEDGYALHAAYWHDDFGIPRSHGCINLSPEDAKWLFSWTQPELPTGWHGVRQAVRGSVVYIHP
jgi:hypothetical protein